MQKRSTRRYANLLPSRSQVEQTDDDDEPNASLNLVDYSADSAPPARAQVIAPPLGAGDR
jgi:hypothetical protein